MSGYESNARRAKALALVAACVEAKIDGDELRACAEQMDAGVLSARRIAMDLADLAGVRVPSADTLRLTARLLDDREARAEEDANPFRGLPR